MTRSKEIANICRVSMKNMPPAKAISTESSFQVSVFDEQRPILPHPNDAASKNKPIELSARWEAMPRFVSVFPSDLPPPQILEGAQRIETLHGDQSDESNLGPAPISSRNQAGRASYRRSLTKSAKCQISELQEYEGEVLSIGKSEFVARLIDLTDKDGPRLEATFSNEEISNSDKSLLRAGAVFYWIMGYKDWPTGQRSNEQLLHFGVCRFG